MGAFGVETVHGRPCGDIFYSVLFFLLIFAVAPALLSYLFLIRWGDEALPSRFLAPVLHMPRATAVLRTLIFDLGVPTGVMAVEFAFG